MNDYLLKILRTLDVYKETNSESVRQQLVELEQQAIEYYNDNGQPELDRGCLSFIQRLLAKVVI